MRATKYRNRVYSGLVMLLLTAGPAAAQGCKAPAAIRARLDRLNQFAASAGHSFQMGDAYLDANCFAEARQWLLKAKAEVAAEPESNAPLRKCPSRRPSTARRTSPSFASGGRF